MKLRLVILSTVLALAGSAQRQPPNRPVRLPSRGTRGAVASGTEFATEAGMRMYFSGGNAVGVFNIGSGVTATISGLTISGGFSLLSGGGGIANTGTLTLTDCTVAVVSSTWTGPE